MIPANFFIGGPKAEGAVVTGFGIGFQNGYAQVLKFVLSV
jgi:hypothetical protein